MIQVSIALQISFILVTLVTVWLFYRAANKSKLFLAGILAWMILQFFLGKSGFYTNGFTRPPRFLLLIAPPLLVLVILFLTKKGRQFMDSWNMSMLTLLHTVRIPVEIILYFLYLAKTIPALMTFEGRNFDIIAGLTAPIIYYFYFLKKQLSNTVLLLWNISCLCLLINIVVIAVLSAPGSLQQFAFDQPNIAIAHFPFNWLASVVVPLVLMAHASGLRRLLRGDKRTI
jgi:hypothetical protein